MSGDRLRFEQALVELSLLVPSLRPIIGNEQFTCGEFAGCRFFSINGESVSEAEFGRRKAAAMDAKYGRERQEA
jgi:hypothetical protein